MNSTNAQDGSFEVGLIGVGLLGSAIAKRLLEQNYSIRGFDLDAEQLEQLESNGGTAAASANEVISNCNIVLLSLPNSPIVATLIDTGLNSVQTDQVFIDTTTGKPDEMVSTGEKLTSRRAHYLEGNIAGSSAQVREGKAGMFVAGDESVYESNRNLLNAIAPRNFYLGPIGSASRFKLVHNLVLGLHRAVLGEAMMFAEALGFSPEQALEILKQTPAASVVMETKGQKMVDRNWTPQAKLAQHLKDVEIILAEAEANNALTPLSALHQHLLEEARGLGFGDNDNSAILEVFRPDQQADDESI